MARGPRHQGALLAMAAGITAAAFAGGSSMPPFLPVGDYPAYDAGAARALVLLEPVVHAPWLGVLWTPLSLAVGGLAAAIFWMAGRSAGGHAVAVVVAMAAFVSRPDLRTPLAIGAPSMLGITFLWACLLLGWPDDRSRRSRLWSAVLAAAAVACWPPLLVVAPFVVVATPASRLRHGAVLGVAMAVGFAVGVSLWATHAGTIAAEPVSLADVWTALSDRSPRGHGPYVWPPLSAAELPAVLAIAGAASAWWTRRFRWLSAAAAAVVTAAALLALPAMRSELVRALYWASWPLVAVGLTWLAERARGSGPVWVVGGMGTVLMAGGVAASVRPVDTLEAHAFAARLTAALRPVADDSVTWLAEDTRLDTALTAWGAGGHAVQRVRQVPGLVDDAIARGRTVLAAHSGRTALELWGFRFVPRAVVTAPIRFPIAAITGRLRCVVLGAPWRELPGLEFTGRLGLHVPAGPGRVELVAIAPPPFDLRVESPSGRPIGQVSTVPMVLADLPPVLWPGGGQLPDQALDARRVEIPGNTAVAAASVSLGVRAPMVAARYVGEAPAASVCAAPLSREDPRDAVTDGTASPGGAVALPLGDPALFTGGWHVVEGEGAAAFRWMAGRAVTLVPSRGAHAVRLAIDAQPAADVTTAPVVLRAVVNGWTAGEWPMPAHARAYEWRVPASAWVDGTNEVAFEVSRTARPSDAGAGDARVLGARVTAFRIAPGD